MTVVEQELELEELEIPKRAKEIGINRITIERDEIGIYYLDRFVQIPILESLTGTYKLLKKRCGLLRLSTEATQWIEVIVELELEKEISN